MKTVETVLSDLATTCERLNIPYAVMGGLAVRVHGIPRPTHDVDITMLVNEAELPQLFDQLEELGYSIPPAYRDGWVDRIADMPLVKLRAYLDEGHGIDADLFLAESPFQQSLMDRRTAIDVEGRRFWVVQPEDLVLLKLIANRPRDLADVGDILFMQGDLDHDYMRHWASQLGVEDRLNQVLTRMDDDA